MTPPPDEGSAPEENSTEGGGSSPGAGSGGRTASLKQGLRSGIAIAAGLFLITLIAELAEVAVVTSLHGSLTRDPDLYFAIRNQSSVLAAKLFYNNVAAVAGGYVTAWIAARVALAHGLVLGFVQLVSLLWGMLFSSYRETTPLWMWIALVFLMPPFIIFGAWLRERQVQKRSGGNGRC